VHKTFCHNCFQKLIILLASLCEYFSVFIINFTFSLYYALIHSLSTVKLALNRKHRNNCNIIFKFSTIKSFITFGLSRRHILQDFQQLHETRLAETFLKWQLMPTTVIREFLNQHTKFKLLKISSLLYGY
jgi:hypothetical protein